MPGLPELILVGLAIDAVYEAPESEGEPPVGELPPEDETTLLWLSVPSLHFSESYTTRDGTVTVLLKAQVEKTGKNRPTPTGQYLLCATGPFDGERYPDPLNPPVLLDFYDESMWISGEATAIQAGKSWATTAQLSKHSQPRAPPPAPAPASERAPTHEEPDSVQELPPQEIESPDSVQPVKSRVTSEPEELHKIDLQDLKDAGRFGDTELVHVNVEEKAMLKAAGGAGSTNPKTGLREYYRPEADDWPPGWEADEWPTLYENAPDVEAGWISPWVYEVAYYHGTDSVAWVLWTTPTLPRQYWAFQLFNRDGSISGTFYDFPEGQSLDPPQSLRDSLSEWMIADGREQAGLVAGWEGIFLDTLGDAGVDTEAVQYEFGGDETATNSVVDNKLNVAGDTPDTRENFAYVAYSKSLPAIQNGEAITPFETLQWRGRQDGNAFVLEEYNDKVNMKIAPGFRVRLIMSVELRPTVATGDRINEHFTVYMEGGDSLFVKLWKDTRGWNDFGIPKMNLTLDGAERFDTSSLPDDALWTTQKIRIEFDEAFRFIEIPNPLEGETEPDEDILEHSGGGEQEEPEEEYKEYEGGEGGGEGGGVIVTPPAPNGTDTEPASPLVWVVSGSLVALLIWVIIRTTGRSQ